MKFCEQVHGISSKEMQYRMHFTLMTACASLCPISKDSASDSISKSSILWSLRFRSIGSRIVFRSSVTLYISPPSFLKASYHHNIDDQAYDENAVGNFVIVFFEDLHEDDDKIANCIFIIGLIVY